MKIENMLQRFSCISFLFKHPWVDRDVTSTLGILNANLTRAILNTDTCAKFYEN